MSETSTTLPEPGIAETIGPEEDVRWQKTHAAVIAEIKQTQSDYEVDRKLARELTSQIVATRRDEDKAALASDEAVAHGLTKLRKGKTEDLESLLDQPYFARVVTEENGREVEFRLGTASFPSERIIDWRKAPISKLYYDYREGDEFSEVIQDREREGVIRIRRSFQGVQENLSRIDLDKGSIQKTPDGWKFVEKGKNFSRHEKHDGHLPPILSLITPEQFHLITRDIKKPIIIQGVAGSGKTTVALHRLAWLLHEDNSDIQPEKSLVVMLNPSLKAYVETTLPELKIHRVPIRTYTQWSHRLLTDIVGNRPRGNLTQSKETEVFKSSSHCLKLLYEHVLQFQHSSSQTFLDELFFFYQKLTERDVMWDGWPQVQKDLQEQTTQKISNAQDDTLLLHLIFAEHGYYPSKAAESLGVCDHVIIDEAQDFGVAEIRALLNAVDRNRTVTIVGDRAQKILSGREAWEWGDLLTEAGFEETEPLQLTVSYRSTEEILKVASKIRPVGNTGGSETTRHGPQPEWIRVETPAVLPHRVGQWIEARLKDSPRALTAVICRWPKQAQELFQELRKLGLSSVRLGYRDQFDFSPGVVITNAHQVKGLEFRNVLIVDPSEENYSMTNEEEKNLLYVAITRAELRLDFIGMKSKAVITVPSSNFRSSTV